MTQARQKIIVVGSGVIGAAAAYELQSRGVEVLIISGAAPRATDASFGWINASFYENPEYFALRVAGMSAYRRLSDQLEIPLTWNGSLCWENTGMVFDAQFRELSEQGYPCEVLERDVIKAREPSLGAPPDRAIHFMSEGVAEPSALSEVLLNGAINKGARLAQGLEVLGVERSGTRITGIRTNVGVFDADQILVAAGTGTQALLQTVDVALPMLHRPALVLRTNPVAFKVSHVLVTEFGEVRQLPNGALITPAAIGHQADASNQLQAHPEQAAEQSLSRLRALFPNAKIELASMHLAHRPMPKDGFPAVGQIMEGLYAATMHSGITLAALVGDLIASEMLDGESKCSAKWLSAFRPNRFEP